MAKKATSKAAGGAAGKGGGSKRKPAEAKARAPRKTAKPEPKPKPKKAAAGPAKPKAQKPKAQKPRAAEQPHGAADAVIKLLESPLVVDLIAVGATAALAAIAEQRFGKRDHDAAASKSAAKAAGKAAAAAMGRRIATEVDEILKASKKTKAGE